MMLSSSQREPETRRPRISSETRAVRSIPSCRTERIRTERSPRMLLRGPSAMVRGAHSYSSSRADPRSRGSRMQSMSSTSRRPIRSAGPRSRGWSGGLQLTDRPEHAPRQGASLPPRRADEILPDAPPESAATRPRRCNGRTSLPTCLEATNTHDGSTSIATPVRPRAVTWCPHLMSAVIGIVPIRLSLHPGLELFGVGAVDPVRLIGGDHAADHGDHSISVPPSVLIRMYAPGFVHRLLAMRRST
jgi:hypothetical protein